MEDRTNRDREKVNIDYDRLYDDLIAGIPEDAPVDDLICTQLYGGSRQPRRHGPRRVYGRI